MSFRPKPSEKIEINRSIYTFTEHPAARGMAYGQTGRRATVYQVQAQDGSLHALKVFTNAWRDPRNAVSALQLHTFANLSGLQVCDRQVFTPESHVELIRGYPDLTYAVLMSWVSGETWQEVMLNARPLKEEQSRELGLAFLDILVGMEREGIAHCDLSGPNVLLNFSPVQVALVDVEDLYGPGLVRPEKVGGGSSGYAHKTAPKGLWRADADRFAGAILLAEMLGWSDERVRRIGYGEQYFDPAEVQQSSERYQVLLGVLREQWGNQVADTFAKVWFSEQLEDCPSFQEWEKLLNPPEIIVDQKMVKEKIDLSEGFLVEEKIEEALVLASEVYQMAPEEAAGLYARALLTRGSARERENNLGGALLDYQKALEIAPESGLKDELMLIVAELEAKVTPGVEKGKKAKTLPLSKTLEYLQSPIKKRVFIWLLTILLFPFLLYLLSGGCIFCVSPQSPTPKTFQVQAKDEWTKTGLFVSEGQTVTITYVSGKWSSCKWSVFAPAEFHCPYVGATGYPNFGGSDEASLYYPDNMQQGCYHGALIARVGLNQKCVGNGLTFTSHQNGLLFISMNDAFFQDNDGSIDVVINVYR